MTKPDTTTSQFRHRQQRRKLTRRARYCKALLKESDASAAIMLQAADLLRELGYDEMALSLFIRCEKIRQLLAKVTEREA